MEMYKCSHCHEIKSGDHFYADKGCVSGLKSICKPCAITKAKIRNLINKVEVIKVKYKPCHVCGKILDPELIDLHHLDPKEKEYNISAGQNSKSLKTLKKEMEKCVPVCRPCHRSIHFGNR
jgi:hypothetical protein